MNKGGTFLCLVFGFCALPFALSQKPSLAPVYQWSQMEFEYENENRREQDVTDGTFIPGVPAPIDVDVYYSADNNHNKIFVTSPKFQAGVPASLSVVTDQLRDGNPVVRPYPDWSWHRNPTECRANRIVSVYRTKIDECDRLWVMDNGRYLDNIVCRPQILAFDLKTNELVHRYEIPATQTESTSIIVNLAVDVRGTNNKCIDTFVYATDCQAMAIIVHDVRRGTSWKVSDKSMYPYPNYGTYSIQGDSFDLMDGILGVALSPYQQGQDRTLFYHAMSSPTENWVLTSDLRNETRFLLNPQSSPEIFHTYQGQRHTQSAAEAMDKNGVMFFGLMTDVTINCWNTQTEYGEKNIDVVAKNLQTLQFASGVKIIKNRKGVQELWVMTSRFQKIGAGTLTTAETNFRIHAGKVDDLLFSSKCKRGSSGNHANVNNGGGGGYGLRPKPSRYQSQTMRHTHSHTQTTMTYH